MISTSTGTSIESYLSWVRDELEKKKWGEISLTLTINNGQVTYVKKASIDTDQIPLKKKGE